MNQKTYIAKMSVKLDNPKSVRKTYWTIINKSLSKKKIPIIPPILVNGELVSDFKQKANIFNNHFASLCAPIKNGSTLLSFSYKTEKRITSFDIKDGDILLILKNLNVNKTHGGIKLKLVVIQCLYHWNSSLNLW